MCGLRGVLVHRARQSYTMHKNSGLKVTFDNEAADNAAWTVRRRGSATHVLTHAYTQPP